MQEIYKHTGEWDKCTQHRYMFNGSTVCEGENNLLVECMAGCTAACVTHANAGGEVRLEQ